jgi:hypothetical protein
MAFTHLPPYELSLHTFAFLCTFTTHIVIMRPEADPPQPQPGCNDIDSVSLVFVALNNIGVSLLVRGACRLSMETFRDSIAVLERVNHQLPSLAEKRLAALSNPSWTPTIDVSYIRVNPISHNGTVFDGV